NLTILPQSQRANLPVFRRQIKIHNLPSQNSFELHQSPPGHHQTSPPKFPSRSKPLPHRKRFQTPIILRTQLIQFPKQFRNANPLLLALLQSKKFLCSSPKIPRSLRRPLTKAALVRRVAPPWVP